MAKNNKLKINVRFSNEIGNEMQSMDNRALQMGYRPIIAMFALLLEWESNDVQEKERKSKSF